MTNHLSPAWIIGFLLAAPSIILVDCEEKVKRQLSEEPLVTSSSAFSCDLVGPGYYADMETECQDFHVCNTNVKYTFRCPGDTRFNQKVFVCDWSVRVDCNSSPDFYSLNSRIGSDEPFLTSPFVNFAARTTGVSTAATIASSVTVPDGQLGSQSQARVKTVRPDGPTGKRSGEVRVGKTTSDIRVGNTLLPNTLFVEVPTFVAKDAEITERPTTETSEPPAATTVQSPDASSSRQKLQSRRRGSAKQRKNQAYGSRFGGQGYLPGSKQKSGAKAGEKDGYLPVEGSGEGSSSSESGGYLPLEGSNDGASATKKNGPSPQKKTKSYSSSHERGSYLPTEGSDAPSTATRGSFLPKETPDVSSTSASSGSYLPERTDDTTGQTDSGSNDPADKPPQFGIADVSFLLPPPSSPELPNSILGAFALPALDEYSPVSPTTAAPRLPPMNLLPLFNEPPPPTEDSQLPSTTESYGVLEEEETEATERSTEPSRSSTEPSRSRQGFSRAFRRRPKVGDEGKNAIPGGKKTAQKPVTEAPTIEPAPEFEYNFDSVRSSLQKRLKDIEPFGVPAETAAIPDGAMVAPPSGLTRGDGAVPSPWLYSLARVPMEGPGAK